MKAKITKFSILSYLLSISTYILVVASKKALREPFTLTRPSYHQAITTAIGLYQNDALLSDSIDADCTSVL